MSIEQKKAVEAFEHSGSLPTGEGGGRGRISSHLVYFSLGSNLGATSVRT